MALFSNLKFDSLRDLFVNQLEDLYDAELRLVDALPKMADAASNPELRSAFEEHLTETRGHATMLEQIFRELQCEPKRETCDAMKGLVKEGSAVINANGDPTVRDAALIAAAQRVEHYEIAGYGTVRNFAHQLGLHRIAENLQQILDQEGNADKLLTHIAESGINAHAA
ncbi:MAG TPA: ferritin-like domain-containing protein [Phycisphaerae bacterium]|nr:ferritin-like domain-containing protein [Phycisphaerae bacterium]